MESLVVIPDLTVKGFDVFERLEIDRNRNRDRIVDLTGPGAVFEIGAMPEGTVQGRPTVMIAADLGDGRAVVLETSLRLMVDAVRALEAAYAGPLGYN